MTIQNRMRVEHNLRGYEWNDLLKNSDLSEKDMLWAKFPSDENVRKKKIRGIPLGNYFKWDPNKHTEMIIQSYQWKPKNTPYVFFPPLLTPVRLASLPPLPFAAPRAGVGAGLLGLGGGRAALQKGDGGLDAGQASQPWSLRFHMDR